MDMGLNDFYPVKPGPRHISDEDAEFLFASAGCDSPDLREWQRRGGFTNSHWASGLEHLLEYNLGQTCSVGVVVLDSFGWRASGILGMCGHSIEMTFTSNELASQYLNNLPLNCYKCQRLMEQHS